MFVFSFAFLSSFNFSYFVLMVLTSVEDITIVSCSFSLSRIKMKLLQCVNILSVLCTCMLVGLPGLPIGSVDCFILAVTLLVSDVVNVYYGYHSIFIMGIIPLCISKIAPYTLL